MITTMERTKPLTVSARDVSGQKHATADAPADATVGELARALIARMNLPQTDVEGRPMSYHVLLEREGRHLHPAENAGDVLQENDQIVLQPKIQAGSRA
jgi:hypothetical protein